ncbi:MAG: GNAT family N-acetyltransferase [Erysipelotrichales bacterium]
MIDTRIDEFKLKKAVEEDTQTIYDFVMKLAVYEDMVEDVITNVDQLKENLFDKKQAEVLLAYYDNEVVGFCLFFVNFSTFLGSGGMYLEDVYIDEKYRNKGLGKEVFYQLAKICQERGYTRFEWVCLDWNKPSREFYEKVIGAQALPEWVKYRLDEEGIDKYVNK